MNLREKLIELRKEKGLTQSQLAKELKISESSIKKYENEKNPRTPEISVLKFYSEYFKVSFDYLLNDSINNKTITNIYIEKILDLSDKAIDNLTEHQHKAITSFLETKYSITINTLFDVYKKASFLKNEIRKYAIQSNDTKELAISVKNFFNIYNAFSKESRAFCSYTYNIENLETVHEDILDGEASEFYASQELDEEISYIYTILENTCKVIKLELFETLSKFLEEE